jgi:hypothetical protein
VRIRKKHVRINTAAILQRAGISNNERKNETATYVNHSERDEYPKVSPTMRIHDSEGRGQELVGGPETAILASVSRIFIQGIASGFADEALEVLLGTGRA